MKARWSEPAISRPADRGRPDAGNGARSDTPAQTGQQLALREMANNSNLASQLSAYRRIANGSPVVQRARAGELQAGDIVEANDDGTMLRGVFVAERVIGDNYLVGAFTVSHVGGLEYAGEEWVAELNLESVNRYAGPPPIKNIPAEGVDITHFAPSRANKMPYGAEYLEPHKPISGIEARNKIEVTNHGLGSGIYGLSGLTPEQIAANELANDSKAHTIHMANPLYLQDADHGTLFSAVSKSLQRAATSVREANPGLAPHDGVEDWMGTHQEDVTALTENLNRVLLRVGRPAVAAGTIQNALFDFFVAYSGAMGSGVVAQPINFLMKSLGYDGVYADNPTDNSFGRGLVSYNLPDGAAKESHVSRIRD